jgi:hypothetical protein
MNEAKEKIPLDIKVDDDYSLSVVAHANPFLFGMLCGKNRGTDIELEEGIDIVIDMVRAEAIDYIIKSENDLSLPQQYTSLARRIYCNKDVRDAFFLRYSKKDKAIVESKLGIFRGLEVVVK